MLLDLVNHSEGEGAKSSMVAWLYDLVLTCGMVSESLSDDQSNKNYSRWLCLVISGLDSEGENFQRMTN